MQCTNLKKLLSREEQELIRYMLAHSSPTIQQRGLQRLCASLEVGKLPYDQIKLGHSLWNLHTSESPKIRQWLYKTIALLRDRRFLPIITHQIQFENSNRETLSWALAALSAVGHKSEIENVVTSSGINFFETHLELSAQLFNSSNSLIKRTQQQQLFTLENDPDHAKWFCLLYGYNRTDKRTLSTTKYPDIDLIIAFSGHDHPEVIEYAIWALSRSTAVDIDSRILNPREVSHLPPNARRWEYQFLARTQESFLAQADLLYSSVSQESNESAREGLAVALSRYYDKGHMDQLLGWYVSEPSTLVKAPLLAHFVTYSSQCEEYTEIVLNELNRENSDPILANLVRTTAASTNVSRRIKKSLFATNRRASRRKNTPEQFVINELNMAIEDNRYQNNFRDSNNTGVSNAGQMSADVVQGVGISTNDASISALEDLLTTFITQVRQADELSDDDKAIMEATVHDLSCAPTIQSPSDKYVLVKKALATLNGVAAALPAATSFVQHIDVLVRAVKSLFSIS